MTRRSPSFGTTIYPSPSGNRREGQIGVTPFMRCIQCGMPNDTRKTAWSNSDEGFGEAYAVTVDAAPGQDTTYKDTMDRDVQGGCRFCGSLKWRLSKPKALPDDRDKPSSEWYARRKNRRT